MSNNRPSRQSHDKPRRRSGPPSPRRSSRRSADAAGQSSPRPKPRPGRRSSGSPRPARSGDDDRAPFRRREGSAPGRAPKSQGQRREAFRQEEEERVPRQFLPRPEADPTPEESSDLIFGRHSVEAALAGDRSLNRIWINARLRYDGRYTELIADAKANGVVVDDVDGRRLSQLANGQNHQGIVAQVAAYSYWELEDLITRAKENHPRPVLLAADGVTDPHNLGAIIRSAEAIGAQGLVIPQRRAVGITSTVSKVAAGATEHLPVARVVNLKRALETLKASGFWIYGLAAEASQPVHTVQFNAATVLVVGSEGSGLSLTVQQGCDSLVSIPLGGKTPSLNASVATGMALYEIYRQQWGNRIQLNTLQNRK